MESIAEERKPPGGSDIVNGGGKEVSAEEVLVTYLTCYLRS